MTINNAKLKACIKLSSKVTVYVPATNGVADAADNTEQVKKTAALLADLFGGSTSTAALGYWLSPVAGLVAENTTVVFAYASDADLQNGIAAVVDHCEALKQEMGQEAVALEINGEMYFYIRSVDWLGGLEKLNSICWRCKRLGRAVDGCPGTTEQVWTGCVYREV